MKKPNMKIKNLCVLVMCLVITVLCFSNVFAAEKRNGDIALDKSALNRISTETESAQATPRLAIPQIERFQVNTVKVYPVYYEPDDGELYYNTGIFVQRVLNSTAWGQSNFLYVSPETTEELENAFEGKEVVGWSMEMKCVVSNYKRPKQFIFTPCSGGTQIKQGAYNGTTTFTYYFPVQDTDACYYDGYNGSFTYYNTSGGIVSLTASGRVYLNSPDPNAE